MISPDPEADGLPPGAQPPWFTAARGRRLLQVLALVVLLPLLLTLSLLASVFSQPGLVDEGGGLNGHAYAMLFLSTAVALVVALFRLRRRTATTGRVLMAGVGVGVVLAVVLLGLLVAGVVSLFLSAGVCNPRC